jgi:hypothetical protein
MPSTPSGTDKTRKNQRVLVKELRIGTIPVYSGAAATRAAARALTGDDAIDAPIGTIVIGTGAVATTKPNLYVRIALAPGDTDYERIVTQASD